MKRDAFSLVEVTIALGIATLSFLAIFALLPVGVRTNQIALEQAAATDLLSAVAADLRATPATLPRGRATSSPRYAMPFPANPVGTSTTTTLFFTTEGRFSNAVDVGSHYRITVTFLPNGAGPRTATFVDLKASWPAGASVENAGGVAEIFVALDRN